MRVCLNEGNNHQSFSIIFPERLRLKCKYQPLICYSIHTTNMESILAVINTTELVVEMRPEKNSGPYEIWTHDLCDTGAATSSAVFITARIDSIYSFFQPQWTLMIFICLYYLPLVKTPLATAKFLFLSRKSWAITVTLTGLSLP